MARPPSPSASTAFAEQPIFTNTSKLFQPFRKIGIEPEVGVGPGVYNCDGLQATVTEGGRPTFLSIDDHTTSSAEIRSYSVTNSSVTRMDEDFIVVGEPLTPDEGEELCAKIANRVESTRSEIKKEFSTDDSPTISDDDVNFFLRSEILAKHKGKMIPFIRDALRKNKEMIEAELKNNPSVTPYEATLHIPELTFREAVTQLRSIDDEQLFAILNLGFDYDRAMRHKPYQIEIQYLEKIRTDDPTANLTAIYEELILHPTHKLLAICLGFSPEFVATVEEDRCRSLIYLTELKQKLLDGGKPLKTVEEMTEIFEQTAAFTDKNQFRGLTLGLDVELAGRLSGDEFEDSFHLEYLTNIVVGNRRISELSDEEKAKKIGEMFTSIEGCENYPQCIAKIELGFPDEIIHATTENMGIREFLIKGSDLENVNFVVNLKTKKPSLTVDELVEAYRTIIYFTDLQFEAVELGLPLEIVERYFTDAEPNANLQLSYLKNFRKKNPETTDDEITAKFNEIQPLKGELQLRALTIGLSPANAKKFAIRRVCEAKICILEDLKGSRPDTTDQQLENFCAAILGMSDELLLALGEGLKKGSEIGLNLENLFQLTSSENLVHFESLKALIAEFPDDYPNPEAVNTKFSELLKAGLGAPAPDAVGAGAAAVVDGGISSPDL